MATSQPLKAPPVLTAGSTETIREAVRVLRGGGVVAVPTDTVYGLVALYDSEAAIARLQHIKGRPPRKPLPVLLGTATELALVAAPVPEIVWPLIYQFWPGPLTIVLPSVSSLSTRVTAGTGTVGVRVPAHPAVLDILEALSFPLASTSANLSGSPPAATALEVVDALGLAVDLVISPAEPIPAGVASTVVDLTVEPYLVRRRGAVSLAQLRETLAARVDLAGGA